MLRATWRNSGKARARSSGDNVRRGAAGPDGLGASETGAGSTSEVDTVRVRSGDGSVVAPPCEVPLGALPLPDPCSGVCNRGGGVSPRTA